MLNLMSRAALISFSIAKVQSCRETYLRHLSFGQLHDAQSYT